MEHVHFTQFGLSSRWRLLLEALRAAAHSPPQPAIDHPTSPHHILPPLATPWLYRLDDGNIFASYRPPSRHSRSGDRNRPLSIRFLCSVRQEGAILFNIGAPAAHACGSRSDIFLNRKEPHKTVGFEQITNRAEYRSKSRPGTTCVCLW